MHACVLCEVEFYAEKLREAEKMLGLNNAIPSVGRMTDDPSKKTCSN